MPSNEQINQLLRSLNVPEDSPNYQHFRNIVETNFNDSDLAYALRNDPNAQRLANNENSPELPEYVNNGPLSQTVKPQNAGSELGPDSASGNPNDIFAARDRAASNVVPFGDKPEGSNYDGTSMTDNQVGMPLLGRVGGGLGATLATEANNKFETMQKLFTRYDDKILNNTITADNAGYMNQLANSEVHQQNLEKYGELKKESKKLGEYIVAAEVIAAELNNEANMMRLQRQPEPEQQKYLKQRMDTLGEIETYLKDFFPKFGEAIKGIEEEVSKYENIVEKDLQEIAKTIESDFKPTPSA